MTEDKPQARPGSPDPDDDVVPHPFGTGKPAEQPAAEDDAVTAERRRPAGRGVVEPGRRIDEPAEAGAGGARRSPTSRSRGRARAEP